MADPRGELILERQSPLQKIAVYRDGDEVLLYLDGAWQFSTATNARYHETLVLLPLLAFAPRRPGEAAVQVAVLGGGDGLAAREVLKRPDAIPETVEYDAAMIELFSSHPVLTAVNGDAFRDARSVVTVKDGVEWVKDPLHRGTFDLVIEDYTGMEDDRAPDPNRLRCYSAAHVADLARLLKPDGILSLLASVTDAVFESMVAAVRDWLPFMRVLTVDFPHGKETFVVASRRPYTRQYWELPADFLTGKGVDAFYSSPVSDGSDNVIDLSAAL